jgi:rhodanese-related sulfurtransferase
MAAANSAPVIRCSSLPGVPVISEPYRRANGGRAAKDDRVADGVEGLLHESRIGVRRLTPHEAWDAARHEALLVDTRTEWQRAAQGEIPGALVIDRTVLEWRLDPAGDAAVPEATDHDLLVVVLCRQGYSSSLAAASLRALGLWRATDVIGGVEAWAAAGLPLDQGPADVRR